MRDILGDACAVPERIYLLFPSHLRITFYAQQIRALELVEQLRGESWTDKLSSIAIVGAGASGMTAAAALKMAGLREGLEITLFESRDQIMPLQTGSLNKFLAPHLIDWPAEGSTQRRARLPILDWDEAIAGNVAMDLVTQFARFDVKTEISTTIEKIVAVPNGVELLTRKDGLQKKRRFDLVIVAAGFGLEAKPTGIESDTTSYWRVHPKQGPSLDGETRRKRFLISGLGDGGLIDFVLFACPGLSHEMLCDRLVNSGDAQRLVDDINAIETGIWSEPASVPDIEAAYAALDIDPLARAVIQPWLGAGMEFTLLTGGHQLFGRGTAPLNRLAAMLVIRAMELTGRGDDIVRIFGAEHRPDRDGKTVYIVGGVEHLDQFDEIVVRHGDTSRNAWDFKNAEIASKVAELRARRDAISERPRTPLLPEYLAAAFDRRQFAARTTRIRLTRQAAEVRWEGDIAIGDVGRLWRVPTAAIHVEIDFPPADPQSKLDLALCRLLVHAEPQAQVAGPHKAAWVELSKEVPRRAGDRTRAALPMAGQVEPGRNSYSAEADQLSDKLEAALDEGLLALIDDRMIEAAVDPSLCKVGFHPNIHERVHGLWTAWRNTVRDLPSAQRRWVVRLFGGLLDGFGEPDPWTSVRVGPRSVEDEMIPAILFHLAMQDLLEGIGGVGQYRNGNVARQSEDGTMVPAAHFCGSRWVRIPDCNPLPIDEWECSWPGEPWVPSCLVLSARSAELLPRHTTTNQNPAAGLLTPPWARTPVIVGSTRLRKALRSGEEEARTMLKSALQSALPEI
ncbi:MAG: NAD(P)-binding protein [Sphingopyxis sp.]|uniref:ABC-three component system protein n=1 Tax=Sphingopyxis sp. TaxID=1908224 RepID=UPI001A1D42E5|nr:ABC-three component system protein [Sphingopyxis sp.]MBJ7501005.1 NAD(P)-binding protein [Sphingopyxis sp.]